MAGTARPRKRLYREILTPALHRRFTRAAGWTLLLCYAEAIVLGDRSEYKLWLWFPVGPAGIRTLLLYICSLSVFVLRVAQLHLGSRTTASPFQTFTQRLLDFNTIQTFGWYGFSTWWFSEVYMWSASSDANLNWISEGKSYERPRLNERPIYLWCVFYMLAAAQSVLHLYYDYDKVSLPNVKTQPKNASEQRPLTTVNPITQLKALGPKLVRISAARALLMCIIGPTLYALFLRQIAWNFRLYIAKILWNLQRTSEPSKMPPYHISLIIRSAGSGFLLLLIWEISNAVFGAYVAQEPLKNGNPLSNDSGDPNGSLLNGLKSKNEVIKTFAFWELLYISQHSESRRKGIFFDIDRAGGSSWSQISSSCLDMLGSVGERISNFQAPKPVTPSSENHQELALEKLPRLSKPLNSDNILVKPIPPSTRLQSYETRAGDFAKSLGNSGGSSPQSPLERLSHHLKTVRDTSLSKEQQQLLSPSHAFSVVNSYIITFLRGRYGRPFRQTFPRRVCSVLFAAPYSDLGPVVDAVDSLTYLAKASIEEDGLGKVYQDVPVIIRAFTKTIQNLEVFVGIVQPHWTDVASEEGNRKVEEVDVLVECLKKGLRELVGAFGQYREDLGLGTKEMRLAREISGMNGVM